MVVNFDFSTIAAGVTSVPFTSGVGHCSDLANSVLDVERKTDGFKCFQRFLLYHSLRGGTGSGMGTLLSSRCAKECTVRVMKTFSVILSTKVSHAVFESYNAILISMSSKRIWTNTCCWRTGPFRVRFDFQGDHVLSIPVRWITI